MAKVCVSKRPQPGCVRSPCHGAPAMEPLPPVRCWGSDLRGAGRQQGDRNLGAQKQRCTESAQRVVKQPTAALGGSPLRLVPGLVMLINN